MNTPSDSDLTQEEQALFKTFQVEQKKNGVEASIQGKELICIDQKTGEEVRKPITFLIKMAAVITTTETVSEGSGDHQPEGDNIL